MAGSRRASLRRTMRNILNDALLEEGWKRRRGKARKQGRNSAAEREGQRAPATPSSARK